MDNKTIWTKDFIVTSIINFFLMLVMYLLIVTIAPYSVKEYGVSTSVAGLVSGIFIIGTLIARLAVGGLIEKVGSRNILLIGLLVTVLASAFYFGAVNLPLLMANRFFHGVGLGISSTATGTMVAQMLPPSRRGEGIGYFSLSTVLATAVGPFFGIFLSQHYHFNVLFTFCLILSIGCAAMFMFVKKTPTVMPKKNVQATAKKLGIRGLFEVRALPIAFVTLLAAIAYSGVLSFISFYAEEINLVSAASFFFLVYAIAVLLSRPYTGKLLDVKGNKFVVYPSLLIFAGGLLLLSEASAGWMLLLAGGVLGLGFGNFQSCAQAIALQGVKPERLGVATSTFFIFLDFGFGFGPYVLGLLVPIIGYQQLYLVLMVVVLIALGLFMLFSRMHQRASVK
ncbi:MFS transporter [Sporosarcina sp. P21c]|uniref:MFS transporter n=1 Tax=Sporosarcina TaxID=1569 RepID=UPI000A15E908|nr:MULTISPECIES: MFS transporter [Sporosarcina]ARJ38881.1 multidrug MFS transporter [Sporosarcina ureae]PIC68280.1 MFS transporter [Sporosarcina sp. P16a]PIC90490.1 MFS transporter [Sporosarcina sp. P21c]PIC94021.1 MFS transporter [Sporosarcina sp. P25]